MARKLTREEVAAKWLYLWTWQEWKNGLFSNCDFRECLTDRQTSMAKKMLRELDSAAKKEQ